MQGMKEHGVRLFIKQFTLMQANLLMIHDFMMILDCMIELVKTFILMKPRHVFPAYLRPLEGY